MGTRARRRRSWRPSSKGSEPAPSCPSRARRARTPAWTPDAGPLGERPRDVEKSALHCPPVNRTRPEVPKVPLHVALRGSFEHAPRALGLVFRSSPGGTIGLAALTLIHALLPLGVAYVGKRIVDAVVARDQAGAVRWVLVELGLVAAVAFATQASSLLRQLIGGRLGLDINLSILEKATGLELRHFEDPEFYDRLTRARREASVRPLSVVTRSFQIVQSVVSLLGYAALLLQFSGWAVFALLAAAVPATVAEMRFSTQAFRLRNWRSPESRRLMYLEYVLANDEHAKEVKLFQLGPLFLGRYRAIGESFYQDDRRLAVRSARWAYLLSLLATGAFYACYVVMALEAVRGAISLGDMTLAMVALRQGQQSFQGLLGAFGGMYEDNLYMSNLFGFLKAASASEEAVAPPSAELSRAVRDERGSASRTSASATRGGTSGRPPRRRLHPGGQEPGAGGAERRGQDGPSSCSRGSTRRPRAASCSTARISGVGTRPSSGGASAWCSRTSRSTSSPRARTSVWGASTASRRRRRSSAPCRRGAPGR